MTYVTPHVKAQKCDKVKNGKGPGGFQVQRKGAFEKFRDLRDNVNGTLSNVFSRCFRSIKVSKLVMSEKRFVMR